MKSASTGVRSLIAAAVFAAVCSGVLAQTTEGTDAFVAKAGNVFVSEREFIDRFEMLPGLYRHRRPQLEGAKLKLLYSIIAEKLLTQEALGRNLEQDTVVQSLLSGVEATLARDELYRQEVSNKVTVSDKEAALGIARAQVQMLVAYIFFEKEEDAHFMRERMKSAKDFDRTVVDSSMGALRDTATVIWGDADPAIEDAAYKLKRGDLSPVVQSGDGFYILKRLQAAPSSFYSSMSPDVLHERVTAKIRSRKEQVRAAEFVDEVLRDKVGRSLPGPFKLLARSMEDVFGNHTRDSVIWLTPDLASELRTRIGASLGDTLCEVGSGRWTIDEVIEKLLYRRFSVPATAIRTVPPRLNAEIRLMVQQKLLGEEAIRRGMENDPSVRRQLAMWSDSYLADIMRDYIRRHVTASDAEVYAYLKTKDPASTAPLVRIRELQTASLAEMHEALSDLEHGDSFEHVIEKWSNDPGAKARKGVSDFFPITERAPLGEIASQMEIGQRYGPVQTASGITYFELLARKQPGKADTSAAGALNAARAELLQLKQRRLVNLFLAQVAQERGFTVFEDRLKMVQVTPVPMMTIRLLGFGGRMPAVPFVQKELEWLDTDPPKEKVLP